MYRPSAFSPKFDCRVDFLTNTPIEIVSYIGVDVLPLDGGYVLFESTGGRNCVFEYTSASVSGKNITLMCSAQSWSNSSFYTDPSNPLTPENQIRGTISRTFTSADWNDIVDHVLNKSNPHDVTKSQVGLGNVDNTSDRDKPVSALTAEELAKKVNIAQGVINSALITDNTGNVTTEPKTNGYNKPFSDSVPSSPSISGSIGDELTHSHSDHQHPSETFTMTAISVLTGNWVYDGTYSDYPYKASISNPSITANHTPIVVFSSEDAMLNKFARVASTSAGEVSIYARSIPSENITIPTIILVRKI